MSGAVLKSKGDMKHQGRGAADSCVSKSGDITIVRWQDNNVVNVTSSFVKMGNIDKVKRWSKKDEAYIDVDCPEIIKYYNDFMGGNGSNGPPHILLLYDVQNETMANQSNTSFVVNEYGSLMDQIL